MKVPNLHTTYLWTTTAWQKLDTATSPIGRGWGVAVTDPVRNNVVVTGGLGDTIRTDNTWTWDGHDWTQVFPATQIEATMGAGDVFEDDRKADAARGLKHVDTAADTVDVFGKIV